MKMKAFERDLRQALCSLYEESESAAISTLILEEVIAVERNQLSLHGDIALTNEQEERLMRMQQRLLQHEPVQYVLGKAWFYGLELYVDKAVLIPRPETEELVDWIVKDVKASGKKVFDKAATDADVTTQLKILDVGTGSGCMALALKKTMPKAEVWGCDVSEEALNVARRNGSALDIRVDFQGVNFLNEAQQKSLPTVDILVSNPPYVPQRDKAAMHPNVVAYEPHTALFVPDDDVLIFYKAIAVFGKKRLYQNGAIYMEIHEGLGDEVVAFFETEGYCEVELRKDMQGKSRMVKAVKS